MNINFADQQALIAGCWQVDADHSTATFTVRNFGRPIRGSVPVIAGIVEIGADGLPSAVEASLDLSGIQTGHPRRDKDLRRPGLLDLDNHPEMTFTADTFSGWRVEGDLAARGTSTRVAGTVEPADAGLDGSATLRASTRFDRRSLGVRAPRVIIGRVIDVEVVARMTRVPSMDR
ncbi:MAG: YceI family protein [Nocardioidaceae bacterium]